MAKARELDLDPQAPFDVAARHAVGVRAQEVFEHAAGVLDTGDIERVHDMRVATRRLRAALEVFATAFPKDELKPVLRDVKRLADALGERRDPDVHIEEFTKLRDRFQPDEVWTPEALGVIRARVEGYNAAIRDVARSRGLTTVDLTALIEDLRSDASFASSTSVLCAQRICQARSA